MSTVKLAMADLTLQTKPSENMGESVDPSSNRWTGSAVSEGCRLTDWAVVIECESPGQPPLDLVVIDHLVEHLASWRATAIYNPDRYALQVVVDAEGPRTALAAASEVHAKAVRVLEMPQWQTVRAEAMTLAELARSWEVLPPNPPLLPKRVWEICPSFTIRMYEVGRLMLRATSIDELSRVLTRFVYDSGGWTLSPGDAIDKGLPTDLSLGFGEPIIPAAEPLSSGRLLLEDALPTLIDDARLLADRLRPLVSDGPFGDPSSYHPGT